MKGKKLGRERRVQGEKRKLNGREKKKGGRNTGEKEGDIIENVPLTARSS